MPGFTAEQRLKRRADFLRVQNSTIRVSTKHFVLLFAANSDSNSPARLGVVATKRIGNAVTRNRVKRIVRETFRALAAIFPNGIDLVVIGRDRAAHIKAHEAVAEWREVERLIRKRAEAALVPTIST